MALHRASRSRTSKLVHHSDRGTQGGFNWSSQHLVMEVVRDGCGDASAGDSCDAWADVVAGPAGARRGDRQRFWQAIAAACRARTRPPRLACRRRLAAGGSATVAGCRLCRWPRCRGAICRSLSGRRSRSCTRSVSGCARSLAGWAVRRRRSRGSCAATRRRASHAVEYRATTAQWHAERRASRPKVSKLAANDASARVRAGAARRRDRSGRTAGPCRGRRCASSVAGTAARAGSAVGEGVESGADRESAPDRLPR